MPTVCKIMLDATDYRKELQTVLAESRAASAALGNSYASASASAQDLADSIGTIPEDKTVAVTADVSQAKAALSGLTDKADLSDKTVAVTADVSQAEAALSDLSDLSDKTYTIRGTVDAPEIPQATDQDYTITGSVNAPKIPTVADQTYAVTGTVNAPKIPEVADQQFSVTADISQAEAALSDLSDKADPSDKTIAVTADVSQAEAALSDLRQQIKNLPDKKNIKVKADTEDAEKQIKKLRELEGSVKKLSGKGLQSGDNFRDLWKEMTNLQGGAKRLVGQLIAGGGAVGIVLAGIQGAVKAVTAVYDLWTQKAKDAAEVGDRNAESLREAAQAQDELRQKTDAAGGKLRELASQEKLSNAAKADAVNLIADLSKGYGNLGVEIDRVTGKISGLDAALIKKAGIDRDRQLANLRAQLKQAEANRDLHTRERDNAGFGIPGSRTLWFGSKDTVEKEQQQINAANKTIIELLKQIRDTEKNDVQKQGREKLKAEVADLENRVASDNRRFRIKQADEVFADPRTSEKSKIESREYVLKFVHADRVRSELIGEELLKQIATLQQSAKNESDPKRRAEIEDQILGKRKELLMEQLRYNRLQEQEYDLKKQISDVEKRHKREYDDLLSAAQAESKITDAILRGEYDKAAALRLEASLRQQNLELSEKEKKELLEQQKLVGSKNLAKRLQDQAFSLYGQAMEKAGRGKEFAEERALREARETKGRDLTSDEIDKIKKLSEISYKMANQRSPQAADLSIKTNSLTARGGFAGGVRLPDTEKIAREACGYNRRQAETAERIKQLLEDWGR